MMTEYWKSQARKYCEFCKCWYADNKVSISFHENGKKHKEHVQKHISQLSKKSAKDFKQKEKMDDDIKKMESAAMAAYLKDVQNNADLTSQSINEMLSEGASGESKPQIAVGEKQKVKSPPVWQEIKNDDGNSYYWNTVTNETTWEEPDEYLSIADQEKQKLKKIEAEKKKEKQKTKKQKDKEEEAIKEVKALMAREKMREFAVKEDPSSTSSVDYGPAPRPVVPYGSWKPVQNEPQQSIDLQLPKVEEPAPPPVVMEPERFKFKEKRVTSLGDGPVDFKKRKMNNQRRNIRQKFDDE